MPAKKTYKQTDAEILLILERTLTENPGRSLNRIHYDNNIPIKVLREKCDYLVEKNILVREGKGTAMRYYPKNSDRRTLNPKADKPLLGKGSGPERKKPSYSPSPQSSLDPPRGIPADLKAFTALDSKEVAPEPAPVHEPEPEPVPAPITEPIPEPEAEIDVDALFAQLDSLRAIPRGGPFDSQLDTMVADAEERIRSSLRECPHCGTHSNKLVTSDEGKHSILCDCGAMFAYAKDPASLRCTIKAYNRRAQ